MGFAHLMKQIIKVVRRFFLLLIGIKRSVAFSKEILNFSKVVGTGDCERIDHN
jgi:hypothetical protein